MVAPSPDSTFNEIRARLRGGGPRLRGGAPGRDRLLLSVAALVGVGVLGFSLLRSGGSDAEPTASVDVHPAASGDTAPAADTTVTTSPAPAPAPMRVHVAGAVAHPGVYALPSGSIGDEAVAAAGGALAEADLGRVNLAGKLTDGQQFYLPKKGEAVPDMAGGAGGADGPGATSAGTPVNLNTATAGDLDELPGIGTATAQKIVDHRSKHGPFTNVRQLLDVPGIGEGKLAALEGLVTV